MYTPNNAFVGGSVTAATVNTGVGANELYAMNQNVRTSDAVSFSTVLTGTVYVSESAVGSSDVLNGEVSTSSTSWQTIAGAFYHLPSLGSDRMVTLSVRIHGKGASGGETACFCVRGFCFGTAQSWDLSDYDLTAAPLGYLHFQNSSYADYYLNLGPFAVKAGQGWRFVVNYRTRNGSYPVYADNIVFEARDTKIDF
jgi:hypothetical protein